MKPGTSGRTRSAIYHERGSALDRKADLGNYVQTSQRYGRQTKITRKRVGDSVLKKFWLQGVVDDILIISNE
jgi:hypothetical protein